MYSWKEIVQNYIARHSDRIKKVSQPIREHFGVAYFTYHRIDITGKYTVLVDRPDWAEHYVEEKIFQDDPYLRHPDVYETGICLIEQHGSPEYKKWVMRSGQEVLDVDLGVILIEKGEDCVEFFGFASKKDKSALEKVYLNQPGLLKSFAVHFKRELNDILEDMAEEPITLQHLKGKDCHNHELISPSIPLDAHHAYLADLGLKEDLAKAALLTNRERECLNLLLAGKSAKDTALFLNLSPRTVEFYFENIKNKLSCWSKQEVLAKAKSLQQLGLLP